MSEYPLNTSNPINSNSTGIPGKALRVVGIACIAGLALALAFTRTLSSMLFGVSPSDPVTLSAVIAVVVGAAVLAAVLPAARAARTDPMQALREE